MVIRKSKEKRKARINVESMLSFSGSQQILIAHNPNLVLPNYSLSFIVNINSNFSLAKGAFSITESDLAGITGRKILVVVNSGAIWINSIQAGTHSKVFNNTSDLIISGDAMISHLAIYNRDLTLAETLYSWQNGGLVPASAHSACVAHYPMTHREGNMLWDVVGQYNYAKPLLNLFTNYGNNSGFAGAGDWTKSTGAAVSILATYITVGNSATSSKRIYVPSNALTKYKYTASIRTARATGIFEIFQGATLIAASAGFGDLVNGNLTNNINFDFVVSGAFEVRYRQTGQGSGSSSDLFNDRLQNNEALSPYHVTLANYTESQHTGSAQTAWKEFYSKNDLRPYVDTDNDGTPNDPLIEKVSLLPPLKNALKFSAASFQHVTLPNSAIPYSSKGYVHVSFIVPDLTQDSRIVSLCCGDNLVLISYNATSKVISCAYRDATGSIFTTSMVHDFKAGQIISLTWVCEGSNIYRFRINGIKINYPFTTGSAANQKWFSDWARMTAYNSFSTTTFFNLGRVRRLIPVDETIYTDAIILDFHIGDYVPTAKEVIEWHNNSLLSNPKKQPFYRLNFNQIIDTAGVYSLQNNGSSGGSATLSGFTADNVNPAHASYSLTPINNLR